MVCDAAVDKQYKFYPRGIYPKAYTNPQITSTLPSSSLLPFSSHLSPPQIPSTDTEMMSSWVTTSGKTNGEQCATLKSEEFKFISSYYKSWSLKALRNILITRGPIYRTLQCHTHTKNTFIWNSWPLNIETLQLINREKKCLMWISPLYSFSLSSLQSR